MKKTSLKRALVLFILCLCSTLVWGQLGSENLSSKEPTFSHQYTFLEEDQYYFIDTSFNSLLWYHQLNHTGTDLFDYSRLGNMGAALNPVSLRSKEDLWGYYSLGAYEPYFKSKEEIPFYYTRSPLTEANYRMGYDRGQSFDIYHTQNVNKKWNFLINYKRLNALGFYTHNRNQHSSFLANTHYEGSTYRLYSYFLNEKMEIEEFGGLENDSIFEENLPAANPRVLLGVNLDQDVRIMRNRQFFMDQRVALNKLFSKPDTDSVSEGKEQEDNVIGLGHALEFSQRSMVYRGQGSSEYYDNYYFENGNYTDSSSYRSLANTIYLEGEVGQKSTLDVRAGIKNLVTAYQSDQFGLTGSNWGLTGSLKGQIADRFDVNASLDYIASGDLRESLDINGEASIRLPWSLKAFGGYSYQLKYPQFLEQFYYSNNFIWENSFRKEGRSDLFFGLKWNDRNQLRVSTTQLMDRIYYNAEALPVQADERVDVFKAELTQNFSFWNFLHQDNRVVYQYTGNTEVLPLPEWVARNALYFEFMLFNGALKCLAGAEVKYFSAYYSPSYNPATGVFYNAFEKKIGDYPLVDAFANFEIHKARIFFKYEHANEGMNGYTYYAAPKYPFADRVLRVGITWRFFN